MKGKNKRKVVNHVIEKPWCIYTGSHPYGFYSGVTYLSHKCKTNSYTSLIKIPKGTICPYCKHQS